MTIAEILAKIAKGEALTDEEKKFALEYKEPTDDGTKIPKARLDQEIAKRKAAEEQTAQLNTQITELQEKLDKLETSGLTEAEKAKTEAAKQLKNLQAQVEKLTKERDEAAKKAADMEFSSGVRELAAKHNFVDADYLGYKLQAAGLKLDDENGIATFMKGLEKESPSMFRSQAKPGAGTQQDQGQGGANATAKQRLEELNKKTELNSKELAEFIALQAEVSKAEEASKGEGKGDAGGDAGGAN
jgi:hypothetical protein